MPVPGPPQQYKYTENGVTKYTPPPYQVKGNLPTTPNPTVKAGPPAPKPATPTSMTAQGWADQLLKDLGINATQDPNAVNDILGQMNAEEPDSSWWGGFGSASDPTRINPLNAGDIGQYGYTGDPVTGNTLSGGLGTYGTLADAAAASAQMLEQGNMSPALAALKAGDDPSQYQAAIGSTPWAGSHYTGDNFTAGAASEYGGPAVTYQNALAGAAQGVLGPAGASADAGRQNTAGQDVLAGGQQQLTAQELQQEYTDTLASLGITQTGYGQQAAEEKAMYGFGQQQLGLQEGQSAETYKNQMAQYGLQGQDINQALANLHAQYAYQTGQMGLANTQATQGIASSGVYNTGTEKQQQQAYGLEKAQAGQSYNYNVQQEEQAKKALALQQQQATSSYGTQQKEYGIQGQEATEQYGYQQQQMANALAQLGLQRTEAGQQFSTGQQQNQNNYLASLLGLYQQSQSSYPNEAGQIQSLLSGLSQSGYTGQYGG